MGKRSIWTRCLLPLLLIASIFAFPAPVEASTFVVNTTSDDPSDGICNSVHCSLREAIEAAKQNPGPDTIRFDIPGPGPHRIMLCNPLPSLTDGATTIDGTTEPDYAGAPVVILEPRFTPSDPMPSMTCTATVVGLWIDSGSNVIRGLSLVSFHSWLGGSPAAIVVSSGENNLIEQNYIGLEPSGAVRGNYTGIFIDAAHTLVHDNVISGNETGIDVYGSNGEIQGNLIGTDPSGSLSDNSLKNVRGISVEEGANECIIGGFSPQQGNVISGNGFGIDLKSDWNLVIANRIGTNLAGDASIPNRFGIIVDGTHNSIGSGQPGTENLISGNIHAGIDINSDDNIIQANAIGTNLLGDQSIPNGSGIRISYANNNIIGSTNPSGGNRIANNHAYGIQLGYAHGNLVQNNIIRSNRRGIEVIFWGINNTISKNSIYENVYLGIDLGVHYYGVTPNDPGDGDEGPNHLLNFPEITSANPHGVSGTTCPGCMVELFESDNDPSSHGEGKRFVEETVADASGNFSIPLNYPYSRCTRLTTTATDSAGNSSEFSENVKIGLCLVIDPGMLIVFLLIPPILGMVIGGTLGRFPNINAGKPLAVGIASGIVVSAGIVGLALTLPGVRIERPEAVAEPPDLLPPCSQYLDEDGFNPPSGAVFKTYENPDLQWSPTTGLPEGNVRWNVELQSLRGLELARTTSDNHLLFSAFNLLPQLGQHFMWRVGGVIAAVGSQAFEPFCDPTNWHSFQFEAPPPPREPPPTQPSPSPTASPTPTPTPTVTPTPTAEVCIYQALQNVNCRSSDYKESAQIAILLQGETAELIALNPEFTHGKFELQNQQQCWIWLSLMGGPTNPFGSCGVPVVDPPPKPTDTPFPCSPDMEKEACEASGGTWSPGVPGHPDCMCP
jgi:CSLREA domain-containing protein